MKMHIGPTYLPRFSRLFRSLKSPPSPVKVTIYCTRKDSSITAMQKMQTSHGKYDCTVAKNANTMNTCSSPVVPSCNINITVQSERHMNASSSYDLKIEDSGQASTETIVACYQIKRTRDCQYGSISYMKFVKQHIETQSGNIGRQGRLIN